VSVRTIIPERSNVGVYDTLPVLANATLIHLLEVIRLEVGVGHQGEAQPVHDAIG
jgi:hypothetical protein